MEGSRPAVGPSAALRLIGHRNFGPYFVGNASSASGTWFQNLAASLLIYRQTHSPFLLGVLQFATFVPVLLLAPWAGSAADRFDRRRLVLVSQLVATTLSASLAALAWSGLAPVWVVIVCSLGLGVVSAFSAPASQALISDLVPRSQLQSAVALNSMTYNLARAVGLRLQRSQCASSESLRRSRSTRPRTSFSSPASSSCSRKRACSPPAPRRGCARA